jgi:N-glycosylase/DNA lyase
MKFARLFLMTDTHEQLKVAFAVYLKEIELFEKKGIKAAAPRARKALQDLKHLTTERRREIQEKKNDL